jgi:hypothetical protein
VLRALGGAVLLIATGSGGARAAPAVSIVAPDEDAILYGLTTIRVAAPTNAARVDVLLDRYPIPVCSLTRPPYECEFDAGTRLESRIVRAEAFDSEGKSLGRDAIVTYSFVDSDLIVVAQTLTVPLVATGTGEAPPDLGGADWTCTYGGEPCKVLEARKLGDNVDGLPRDGMMRYVRDPMVERPPISLEVLIDVSPSVFADRSDIEDALSYVIDHTPAPIEVSIAEFAGDYRKLVPFTSSKSALRRGLRDLTQNEPYTCVLGAVRRSLAELHSRPGHKALLLISDGQETCEAQGGREPAPAPQDPIVSQSDPLEPPAPQPAWIPTPMRARREAIEETRQLSRLVGIPIYVYRVGGDPVTSLNAVQAFQEMTAESGGLWLPSGDLAGLSDALSRLLSDLESTWMLDIALPAFAVSDHEAELSLRLAAPGDVGLRYPEKWRGGNRDALLLTLLRLGDREARGWAAAELRDSHDPEVLQELLAAYRREESPANRIEQMSSIYHVSAYLLLHGNEDGQRASLSTLEELWEIDPILIRRLRPALRTFQKMDPSPKLRAKAEQLADPEAARRPAARPNRQG